jgi:hypothetical protein
MVAVDSAESVKAGLFVIGLVGDLSGDQRSLGLLLRIAAYAIRGASQARRKVFLRQAFNRSRTRPGDIRFICYAGCKQTSCVILLFHHAISEMVIESWRPPCLS